MPKQFRVAYLARAPWMGHAAECGCGGVGMIQVAHHETVRGHCPGPRVFLPEAPARAEQIGPGVATVTPIADFAVRSRAKTAAALDPTPEPPHPAAPRETHEWDRPNESYFRRLDERRRTEQEAPDEPPPSKEDT